MAWREESSPAFRRPEAKAPAPDTIVVGCTVVMIIVIMPAIIVNLLPMMTTLNGKSLKFPSRFFQRTDDRLGSY